MGVEVPLLFSVFITIYTMKDMKLIMESFQNATAKLVREGDRPEEHLDDLGPVEEPAYGRDGKQFIPELFQQLYDRFPGLENLLVHSARAGEVEGKALSPMAKMIMGVSPKALESSPAHKRKKKPCKPSKGKRFAKRVDGKCRSYGQAGKAKDGGDRIRPGTKKADAYCARSAKIKKCKNPPCANTLSRKKWKCRGSKSMRS